MKKTIYAAYGSNLNHMQMKVRCPDARYLGTSMLKDYSLLFCGQPANSYASVESELGKEVPIGLWEISERDEKALDSYEGYPKFYDKAFERVMLSGKETKVMLYVMNPDMKIGLPSSEYYDIVLRGYQDCSLDPKYLIEALRKSIEEVNENRQDMYIGQNCLL